MTQGARKVDSSPQQVHDFFKGKGWTSAQAWGIAGNVKQESGFASNAFNHNALEKSYGLFQFNSKGNPAAYSQFERMYNKPLTDATALEQMEFVNWQLHNTEKNAGDGLRKASTPYDAGMTFGRLFERPKNVETIRGVNAEQFAKVLESRKITGAIDSASILANPLGYLTGKLNAMNPTNTITTPISEAIEDESFFPSPEKLFKRVALGLAGLALLMLGLNKMRI